MMPCEMDGNVGQTGCADLEVSAIPVRQECKGEREGLQSNSLRTVQCAQKSETDSDVVQEPLLVELLTRCSCSDGSCGACIVTSRISKPRASCMMCHRAEAPYRCPGCSHWSCSLECVRAHKTATQCAGSRPLVEPVPINQFDDRALQRDVHFLDHMSQVAERCARVTARVYSERVQGGGLMFISERERSGRRQSGPLPLSIFRRKCEERQIRLRFCPPELSKRRANTTQLTRKSKRLSWRVEWLFPHIKDIHIDAAVPEDSKIGDLVKRFVQHPTKLKQRPLRLQEHPSDGGGSTTHASSDNCTPSVVPSSTVATTHRKWPLRPLALKAGFQSIEDCEVLFQDLSVPSGGCKAAWFALDKKLSLLNALRQKVVYEFPTFHVIPSKLLGAVPYTNFTRVAEEPSSATVLQGIHLLSGTVDTSPTEPVQAETDNTKVKRVKLVED